MAVQSLSQPACSGIYEIVNTLNGKRYVGSAVGIPQRWKEHRSGLKRGNHHSRHLQASWNKYGADAFVFRTMFLCDPKDLLFYEQRAFDATSPAYNVARVAGNTLGTRRTAESRAKIAAKAKGRKYSAETIAKRSATCRAKAKTPKQLARIEAKAAARKRGRSRPKSPEVREKIAAALTGRKATAESRANQSAAQLGMKRKPYVAWTEERRERFVAALGTRPNPNLGRKMPPHVREGLLAANLGRKQSEADKAKKAEQLRLMWADPETRGRVIAAQRAARLAKPRFISPETRQKMTASLKGFKHSDETRRRMSEAHLGVKRGSYKPRKARGDSISMTFKFMEH